MELLAGAFVDRSAQEAKDEIGVVAHSNNLAPTLGAVTIKLPFSHYILVHAEGLSGT